MKVQRVKKAIAGPQTKKRPEKPRTRRWRDRLRGKGLGRPRMESGRVRVCALLIEDGRSHDVRGTALVALIRVQLRNGCHAVVHELATACDTGLFDEILARFLQIDPTLSRRRKLRLGSLRS